MVYALKEKFEERECKSCNATTLHTMKYAKGPDFSFYWRYRKFLIVSLIVAVPGIAGYLIFKMIGGIAGVCLGALVSSWYLVGTWTPLPMRTIKEEWSCTECEKKNKPVRKNKNVE